MKKELEKKIIDRIYDCSFYIEQFERPDFIVNKLHSNLKFGVEVTEIYRHSSHAVFKNDKQYFQQLIEGKYRNKSHEKYLDAGEFTLESLDGSISYKLNGVKTQTPSCSEYIDLLCERIGNKNRKILKYEEGLEYINLIIFDNDNGLNKFSKLDIMNGVLTDKLMKEMLNSRYSEIFITSGKVNDIVTYPLKFMSTIRTIIQIFMQYKKFCNNNNIDALNFTSFYFNKVYNSESNVICYQGNYGIVFEDVVYEILPKTNMKRKSELQNVEYVTNNEKIVDYENCLMKYDDEFSKRLIVNGDAKLFFAL